MTIILCDLQSSTDDPFFARYGEHLPRGLRESARGLTWAEFCDAYGPSHGLTVEFLTWCRTRGGSIEIELTLADDGARTGCAARGSGPISAATDLLYRRGLAIEAIEFHQLLVAEGVATFLRTVSPTSRTPARWSFAIAHDAVESAVRALIAGASMHR